MTLFMIIAFPRHRRRRRGTSSALPLIYIYLGFISILLVRRRIQPSWSQAAERGQLAAFNSMSIWLYKP